MKLLCEILFTVLILQACSGLEHVKYNFYKKKKSNILVYETYPDEGKKEVYRESPSNLDIESAVEYGEYLVDKDNVFVWYGTSDGDILIELENVDRETFEVLGNSIYSKDKNHVYDTRHGVIEKADVHTFEVINFEVNGPPVYGKDKDNYFFWDEIITDTTGFGNSYKLWKKNK